MLLIGDKMNKSDEYFNQRIACRVNDCKFHDHGDERCTLGEIIVDGKNQKKDTFCNSFINEDEK